MSYVYPASTPLGWSVAGVTLESVTTAGRDNEAASEKVTYRLTAQCLVWLLRPSTHCYSDHVVMRWSWLGEWSHGGSDSSSLPRCCQSLHLTQSTTDAFFTHATRACSLASWVAQRDTFCPSLAIYFISTTWQMRLGSADRPLPAKISGSESASDCGPRPQSTHHRQFCLPQPHRSDTGNERLVT